MEPTQPPRPAVKRRLPRHKPQGRWPGATDKKLWQTVNTDLTLALEQLQGTVENKMERMGDIIYQYAAWYFRIQDGKNAKKASVPPLSKRLNKIKFLVQEKRQLRKRWKKASGVKKEGINVLQADIKTYLASLRRTENLHKLRRKKEQTRIQF